jgi:hypothetical protein
MGYSRKRDDKVKQRNPFGFLKATGDFRRGDLQHKDRRRKVDEKFQQRVNRDAEQE